MDVVRNPVLPGFYPDPSVCAVDKIDESGKVKRVYYMVNSTFSYVPGIPVFYSENLCNWEQIGHVLTREEQLNLSGASMSEGIYAPSIRYYKGIFYVITTNVSGGGNFYVTAKEPAGEWSDPVYLSDAEGIDPSLFFEGNVCYYVGQRTKKDALYVGDCEIWLQQLDLGTGRLVGEVYVLWDGALRHAVWPEGPHLYKRGNYYYLLIAEGGTEYSHSICVARSSQLCGPYESCPNNPVFTHRHLGSLAPIQNAGHGEMVEDEAGNWFMYMLATRPVNGCAPLGRETFVAEVRWENDWPVVNPGIGQLRKWQQIGGNFSEGNADKMMLENKMDLWEETEEIILEWAEPLDKRCLFFRYPKEKFYKIKLLDNKKSVLQLKYKSDNFRNEESPSYIGIRVTDLVFSLSTKVDIGIQSGGEAGLVYLHDEMNYVKWVLCRTRNNSEVKAAEYQMRLVLVEDGVEKELFCENVQSGERQISFVLNGVKLGAYLGNVQIGPYVDASIMTSERKGGFVGCTVGVYAGKNSDGVDESENGMEKYALFWDTKIEKGIRYI